MTDFCRSRSITSSIFCASDSEAPEFRQSSRLTKIRQNGDRSPKLAVTVVKNTFESFSTSHWKCIVSSQLRTWSGKDNALANRIGYYLVRQVNSKYR